MNRLTSYLLLAAAILLDSPLRAQVPAGEVRSITIQFVIPDREGVKEDFILNHIRIKVGDLFKPGMENEDVKTLMATGQLRNVRVGVRKEGDGVALVYHIERTPKAGVISLRGRDGETIIPAARLKYRESKLRALLTLRQGEPYTEKKIAADVEALEEFYHDKGYYQAKVNVDQAPGFNVTYEIAEGEKVRIEKIEFQRAHSIQSINTASDLFTTDYAHDFATGDPVKLFAQERGTSATAPLPTLGGNRTMSRLDTYYAAVTATNRFTLHASREDALNSANRINILANGPSPHYVAGPGLPVAFDEDTLEDTLESAERRRWLNPITWFTGDGRIMESKQTEDIRQLRRIYLEEGYLDMAVDIVGTPDRDFEQGSQFDVARSEWRRAQRLMDTLAQHIENLDPGQTVEIEGVERTRAQLETLLAAAEETTDAAYDRYYDELDKIELATISYRIAEGRQYTVGRIDVAYGTLEDGNFVAIQNPKPVVAKSTILSRLIMRSGAVFRPQQLRRQTPGNEMEAIEDLYGEKSYIRTNVNVIRRPNPDTGKIDIDYQVVEGLPVFVELIRIEGNVETKDNVLRRELAIQPGEPFDMGRVKLSEERLNGLRLFESVRVTQEPLSIPGAVPDPNNPVNREHLIFSVKEKDTGRAGFGGGFNTDYGAIGNVFYSQENFDIMRWRRPHPLQGGGQKFRIRAMIGSRRDDYILDYEEPWLFDRKLRFTTSLYASEYEYFSNLYDVSRAGMKLGLEQTLFGMDHLRGGISYTVENTGIVKVDDSASVEMKDFGGRNFISKFGTSLAYDTRGGGYLPTKGQRTEFSGFVAGGPIGGDSDFYKLNLNTAQYFPGLGEGHVIEVIARTGVVDNYGDSTQVPYLERYTLGGSGTLRGFDFREVGPRDAKNEVIGGKSMWMGTLEYSVPTPFADWARVATFYDIGNASRSAFKYDFSDYNDDWGIGLRLDVPFLGPLRFDYAFPINTDSYNDDGGQFNFSFGYTQAF